MGLWPSPAFAPGGATAFGSNKFEPHSLRSLTLSGGSGIRTHVVTGTNALAGRRF